MPDPSLSVTVLAAQLCARVPGGTGRYTAELLRALTSVRPAGTTLRAVTSRPCAGLEGPDGLAPHTEVTSLPVPYAGLARLWERGLPPRVGGSVVHAPTLLVPPVRRGSRLVVTVHDVVPWTHPETLTPRGVAFHRRMGERTARTADLVVTPTEAVAARVRELLAPSAPVVAVPPGVSSLVVPDDAPARRAALGLPAAYLLFVGTAEPRKGLDVLLEALGTADLADRALVVVGPPGWGDVDVVTEARRRGVAGRVVVTGRVGDNDLAAVYAGASALALPSRAEGFGLPVLEGMSLGVPVVTSDDPALVEAGGGAATVVPVGDVQRLASALAEVVARPDAAVTMRTAGRARAATFSWSDSATRLWGLYQGL